jgi:LysR family cys regulon transcriptional activator
VLSALDTEVVKSYVELGLGIAVLLSIAYERNHDRGLGVVDVAKLFPPTVPAVLLRRGGYLRGYMHDFIERLAPQWDRASVDAAIRSGIATSVIAAE